MATSAVPQIGVFPGPSTDWTAQTGDASSLSRRSHSDIDIDIDDEEFLRWEAIQKLPSFQRLQSAVLLEESTTGGEAVKKQVNLRTITAQQRLALVERALNTRDQDNEILLKKLRERIDRVGIDLPSVEIRFRHLSVDADVFVGGRALPTLLNFTRDIGEKIFGWMCFWAKNKKQDFPILHDINGVLKPGRMTLLLGPPGSGKTSLLLALAGKLDKELQVEGEITYNGVPLNEFVPQRTAAYISQNDRHIGTLTVRETLDFSARCQGTSYRNDLLRNLEKREREANITPDVEIDAFMKAASIEGLRRNVITDYIMKILGLDICADTMVGNEMLRGISGGQKKRVTTGEMIVGPKKTLFMDEISTGLDSSTTFQIVKAIRNFTHLLNGTVLMALLQPAPETFGLFDDIMLLSEGLVVYYGPRERVLEFFEIMGFSCPPRKGVADFLQEVTSMKDQGQYWSKKGTQYRYVPVQAFADTFKEFEVGRQMTSELEKPVDPKYHPDSLVKKKYALNTVDLFRACMQREWTLMKRDRFLYTFKTCQVAVVAFITMTLFFRTTLSPNSSNEGNIYLGALFFALVHMMFNGFAEMSITVSRLGIFYKQRDDLFYPGWAYSVPTWVLRLPYSIVEAIIWTSMTYYVIGFSPSPGRFFRHMLLMFSVHQMALGLFRFIGALGRSMVVANTFGSFSLLVVFLLGGFIVAKPDIHPWWIWGYWVSPLSYGENAIAVNEFTAERWQNKPADGLGNASTLGNQILQNRGIPTEDWWYWLGTGVLFAYSIIFNVLATLALQYLQPLGKAQVILSEEAIAEKTANRTGEMSPLLSERGQTPSLSKKSLSLGEGGVSRSKRGTGKTTDIPKGELELSENAMENGDGKTLVAEKGMILPFKPLSLTFHNVNYFVDMPQEMKDQGTTEDRLQLLRNVSGSFCPGVLTALVGVSGAGKTTLMDVLAGRKTGGYIEGDIRVSGYPKKQETFARVAGYCEQTDIHSPNVTVYESLIFSAWLRLSGDVSAETRKMFVDEVMDLVELSPLRNALVGLPGISGLSTEQRKRLTIAVELVANPSIIFMDEPTSGLDARAAAIVMRTVRNTVDTGRTVVCTIHQPSIDIFEAFDELLLMKRGGQVIYQGPLGTRSSILVDYFQAIEGVPRIKEGYNPATWMLDVTTPANEQRIGVDFADIFRKSGLYKQQDELIRELSKPSAGHEDLTFSTVYSQSFPSQILICLWKNHWTYWRTPQYKAINFFFTQICALIFGTIFWGFGKKRAAYQDIFNVMGALYAAVLFIGVNNSSTVQPVISVERTVFYRERAAGMYSPLPYAIAQGIIELPYVLLQTVVYAFITYAMIQFEWTAPKFLWYTLFMYLTFMYFTFYGMMTVSVTPNQNLAAVISSAFYSIWNLFSGFLIPRPQIPGWWVWYYWMSPVAWTLYGLITSQLGDVKSSFTTLDGQSMKVEDFVTDYFGFHHNMLGVVVAVLIGFDVLFWVVYAAGIKFLNFQKR